VSSITHYSYLCSSQLSVVSSITHYSYLCSSQLSVVSLLLSVLHSSWLFCGECRTNFKYYFLISTPSLGVYYCQQVTLSDCPDVCPSVCVSHSFKLFLLFVSRWNWAIFWPSFLHVPLYKTLFFDFWFRPLTSKICSPQFAQNRLLSQLVWQIDRRCLHLPGGFRGWLIQWNHAKCCGADSCCHGNEIWARCGDPDACRLVFLFLSQKQVRYT